MKVISVIENEEVIKKILKHLGLWEVNPPEVWRVKPRPPPKATGPQKTPEYSIDHSTSLLPCLPDVAYDEGGSDKWLYVDPEYPEVYPPLEGHPA